MSREPERRKNFFQRDPRDPRDRRDFLNRDPRQHRDSRDDYRSYDKHRSISRKSPVRNRGDGDRRRSRSPRKNDNKDGIDETILSEISKLPEPSELWDSQFQDNSFPPPLAPSFNHETVSNQSYPASYSAQTYSGLYDDFPPVISSVPAAVPPAPEWNQLSLPSTSASSTFIPNIEDQMKKEAAIESEMRHQKAALSKQREDYMKKAGILKKELDTLKDQRNELRGDAKRSPSPDTKRFLKENTKLQLEIQNKLKTINNVVDMLNGIIGEEAQEITADSDGSADRSSKRKSRSPTNKKSNYVYYDPEMHWCRVCNEFPPTAKDYLNHLHSPAHHKMAAAHMEAPWHTVSGINEGFPSYPSAPTKRTPIRGLQFFVPSTAWYCKLCDQFIGDLHCASAHLKSVTHSKNYCNFVEQNPHWETDWMSDRQKALEKSRANSKLKPEPSTEKPQQYAPHTITFHKDGFHTKNRKDSPPAPVVEEKKKKDKKKKIKKRKQKSSSSSSSSDSESSDTEHRVKKKKKKKENIKSDADDKMLSEWMSSIHNSRLTDNDRKLLDTLKSKIKQEKDDKHRSPERSQRDTDRERSIVELQRKLRNQDEGRLRRRSASNDAHRERDRERERERESDREKERDVKKPEIRKMPFIGKMPVYKSLTKTSKFDESKKEEQKKKDDDDASKKRREEMDAEIQKKVAEFKEKIAKAQQEREQAVTAAMIGPPQIALPTELGSIVAPQPGVPAPQPPPVTTAPIQPPVPNLPKDFQEALDIIFPSDAKKDLSQDIFSGLPLPGFLPGMTPFPPIMPNLPFMNPFDMNPPLFQPRPQLYDAHIPLVPPNHKRQNNKNKRNIKQNNQNNKPAKQNAMPSQKSQIDAQAEKEKNGKVIKMKEELDDLAMLGIDASDVGAGI